MCPNLCVCSRTLHFVGSQGFASWCPCAFLLSRPRAKRGANAREASSTIPPHANCTDCATRTPPDHKHPVRFEHFDSGAGGWEKNKKLSETKCSTSVSKASTALGQCRMTKNWPKQVRDLCGPKPLWSNFRRHVGLKRYWPEQVAGWEKNKMLSQPKVHQHQCR